MCRSTRRVATLAGLLVIAFAALAIAEDPARSTAQPAEAGLDKCLTDPPAASLTLGGEKQMLSRESETDYAMFGCKAYVVDVSVKAPANRAGPREVQLGAGDAKLVMPGLDKPAGGARLTDAATPEACGGYQESVAVYKRDARDPTGTRFEPVIAYSRQGKWDEKAGTLGGGACTVSVVGRVDFDALRIKVPSVGSETYRIVATSKLGERYRPVKISARQAAEPVM